MTSEQLEELRTLLEEATPPRENGKWFPAVDFDGCFANEADWELSKQAHSLARRVLAAEKLVEALEKVPLGDGPISQLVTAYREASK